MTQDALHHDFILNLGEQLIGDAWVEDLLNSYRCSIQGALVDHGEATLADLLTNLNVGHLNFTDTWDGWQSSRRR